MDLAWPEVMVIWKDLQAEDGVWVLQTERWGRLLQLS